MMPSPEKLIKYQKNPLLFLKEVLDNNIRWPKQIEIMESVRDNRNTYVKSCHGVGKTYTAKDVVLWFLCCFQPSIVLTTAPSWPQVEKLLWAEINTAFKQAKVFLGGQCNQTELNFNSNWFALGISPKIDTEDEGKRLTGFHSENLLVVFDEAPSCNPKLWEIKETLMTSENVRFLAIGNPVDSTGKFYEGFKNSRYNRITMSLWESPNFVVNNIKCLGDIEKITRLEPEQQEMEFGKMNIVNSSLTTPRWAVERLIEWGSDSPLFQSRVMSEFPTKTTDTIISLTSLEKCKNIIPTKKHHKILGVDVARFGSDDTVFYGYENYRKICKEKFNGQDLVKTSNMILHKIMHERYQTIVIDDTGMGGGVTDILFNSEHKSKIIPVNFGEKAINDEYDGIVTDMYYFAKDLIESGDIRVDDEGDLFQQLTSRKYKFTNKGKIKIESKDEYKKRTGKKSPDESDAFILCLWGLNNQYMSGALTSDGERETLIQAW